MKRCLSSWQILRYDWDLSGAPSLAQSRMRFFSRYLPSTLAQPCGLGVILATLQGRALPVWSRGGCFMALRPGMPVVHWV